MSQNRLTDLAVLPAEKPMFVALSLKEVINGFTEQHNTLTFYCLSPNNNIKLCVKRILGTQSLEESNLHPVQISI